jgi:FixJ family two-component response regulator
MDVPGHVVVVHDAPLVMEALDMTLSSLGFQVHAGTFREATVLLRTLRAVAAVVAHADMPLEPLPGTLLRMARALHPDAALVVLSARTRGALSPLPRHAVLLREPFDRAGLFAAIGSASGARSQAVF